MAATLVRRLSCCWNWKSALFSAVLRSPLFVAAGFQNGLQAAATAGATDVVFRLTIAGIAGAVVQRLSDVRPRWASTTAVVIGVPLFAHTAEALVHASAATPHWVDAFRASVVMSAVSVLFTLYAMRRGALIAGDAGRPLRDDLWQMPRLIAGFLRHPFR